MQRGEECTSVRATSCPASPPLLPLFPSILPIRIDSFLPRGPFSPEKGRGKGYVYSKKKKKKDVSGVKECFEGEWLTFWREKKKKKRKKEKEKRVSVQRGRWKKKKCSFPAKPRIECKSFPSEADNYAPRRPTSSCSSLCDLKEARGGGSTGREFVLGSGRTLPPPRPPLLPPRRLGTRGGGYSARCCEPVCRCSQIFLVRRTDDIAFILPSLRLLRDFYIDIVARQYLYLSYARVSWRRRLSTSLFLSLAKSG